MFVSIPEGNVALIDPEATTTTLDLLIMAAVGYWIGSSSGSATKQAAAQRRDELARTPINLEEKKDG